MKLPLILALVAAVFALGLAFVCWTPRGFTTPGMGMLLKASAFLGRDAAPALEPPARRLASRADVATIDRPANAADGITRKDLALDLPGRSLDARLYLPTDKPIALIVFYHGGGWVVGDLDSSERLCRDLAAIAGSAVLSVSYRLAPELPYPAAHDDCYDAYLWARGRLESGQLIPGFAAGQSLPIVLSGDSAGGNLAAASAIHARNQGKPIPEGTALIYPVTDLSNFDTESHKQFAKGFLLTKDDMDYFRGLYMPEPSTWSDPRASVLLEPSLAGLSPTFIATAGFDVLRDEGEAYAKRLKEAGVQVTLKRYGGMAHGFAQMSRFVRASGILLSDIAIFVAGLVDAQAARP